MSNCISPPLKCRPFQIPSSFSKSFFFFLFLNRYCLSSMLSDHKLWKQCQTFSNSQPCAFPWSNAEYSHLSHRENTFPIVLGMWRVIQERLPRKWEWKSLNKYSMWQILNVTLVVKFIFSRWYGHNEWLTCKYAFLLGYPQLLGCCFCFVLVGFFVVCFAEGRIGAAVKEHLQCTWFFRRELSYKANNR